MLLVSEAPGALGDASCVSVSTPGSWCIAVSALRARVCCHVHCVSRSSCQDTKDQPRYSFCASDPSVPALKKHITRKKQQGLEIFVKN